MFSYPHECLGVGDTLGFLQYQSIIKPMRTRTGLRAAKARGVKLGGPKLKQARQAAVRTLRACAQEHSPLPSATERVLRTFLCVRGSLLCVIWP